MPATFNENIELSVLSCLFKDGSLFPVVEDILTRKMFGHIPFGTIFQSISDVVSNDLYPDVATVYTDLDRKGISDHVHIPSNGLRGKEALKFISDMDVNKENIEGYAYQISELYASRLLLALSDDVRTLIENGATPLDVLSTIDLQTGKISVHVGSQSKNIRTSMDVAKKSVEQFQEAVNGKDLYVPTLLKAWDDFTNGLFPGRTYMVAASSNDGKTSLVLDILNNLAVKSNVKTMMATFESGAEEIHNKLIQINTGISPLNIEKGKLTPSEESSFAEATEKIARAPIIYEDSSGLSIALLRTKVRKAVADGAKAIIIDQLEQLYISTNDNQPEYLKLNYMSYRVKAIARENNVPIILVHQTNRSADSGLNRGKNVDPQIQDIAQSGEKACDAIVIIRHKKEGQEVKESFLHWVKNRQGMKGKRKVKFEGNKILFRDLTKEEMQEPEFINGDDGE